LDPRFPRSRLPPLNSRSVLGLGRNWYPKTRLTPVLFPLGLLLGVQRSCSRTIFPHAVVYSFKRHPPPPPRVVSFTERFMSSFRALKAYNSRSTTQSSATRVAGRGIDPRDLDSPPPLRAASFPCPHPLSRRAVRAFFFLIYPFFAAGR